LVFIKKVVNSDAGDADHVGGNDWDALDNYFDDIDITGPAKVNTATRYRDQKLVLRNPADTFSLTYRNPALSANKDFRFYEPYSYLIYVEGANTYCKNGLTGAIETSAVNSAATPVAQYALDNLTIGRTQKEAIKFVGNFIFTNLSIPSYTYLDFRNAYVKQQNSSNVNFLINSDTSGGNTQIEIAGGIIDGNKALQTADGANYNTRCAINFSKVTDSHIHDVYNVNSNSSGIFIGESTNVKINNNSIITPRACGIRADATSASTPGSFISATNNYMYNNPENFLAVCTTTDVLFAGNLCDINGTNGVNCTAPRQHILNNTIKLCDRGGITLGAEATPFGAGDHSEIIGNLVWDCKGGGIYTGVTQGGDYVTIKNNKVKGHPTLQDNTTGRAFGIRARGSYIIIEGNQVWDWFRTGISVTGSNSTSSFDSRNLLSDRVMIKNNICVNNGNLGATEATSYFKGGIALYGSSTETAYNTNHKIVGNICYNNTDYGILIRNTTDTVVQDNDLVGNVIGPFSNVASNTTPKIKNNTGLLTEASGSSSQNGNGSTKVFNIAHGLSSAPTKYVASAGHADAVGPFVVTADATNVIITYPTAPQTGTNNVILRWIAEVA
jgi:parallel beta-helix repeat protein